MPRSRNDGVIARAFIVGDRHAIDGSGGDNRCQIVARIIAAVFCQRFKIGVKIGDSLRHKFGGFLRRDIGCAHPVQIRILPAEQFLRQLQHQRLVALRNAKQFHHDMQGIHRRHVARKITRPIHRQHLVDGRFRDRPNIAFYGLEVCRHEPILRQPSVFGMLRRVHLYQRLHQMRAAVHEMRHKHFGHQRRNDDGRRVIQKGRIVLADLQYVCMPRDDPKWAIARYFSNSDGGIPAKCGERIQQRTPIPIYNRVDDMRCKLRRNLGNGGHAFGFAQYSSRSRRLYNFPVSWRGSSSRKSIRRGILTPDSFSRA